MYGIRLHPAKDREGSKLSLAVAHTGVLVFQVKPTNTGFKDPLRVSHHFVEMSRSWSRNGVKLKTVFCGGVKIRIIFLCDPCIFS